MYNNSPHVVIHNNNYNELSPSYSTGQSGTFGVDFIVGFLFLAGLIILIEHWAFVVAIAAIYMFTRPMSKRLLSKHPDADPAAIRAEYERIWREQGDPRGTYGLYPPAI